MPTQESTAAERSDAPVPPPLPTLFVLVAVAGAVGALLRLGIGQVIPEQGMKFPWTTLAINASGSGLIGVLTGIAAARPALRRWVVPVLGTGLLGSYTTFSLVILAVMPSTPGAVFEELSAVTYVNPGTLEMASYLLISIIGCTAAAAAGVTIGRVLFGRVEDPLALRPPGAAEEHSNSPGGGRL